MSMHAVDLSSVSFISVAF